MQRLKMDFNAMKEMTREQQELMLAILQRMEYTEKKKNNIQEVIDKIKADLLEQK